MYADDGGYLPAVVYEKIEIVQNNYSHVVLAGEAIWTSYKYMYDYYILKMVHTTMVIPMDNYL